MCRMKTARTCRASSSSVARNPAKSTVPFVDCFGNSAQHGAPLGQSPGVHPAHGDAQHALHRAPQVIGMGQQCRIVGCGSMPALARRSSAMRVVVEQIYGASPRAWISCNTWAMNSTSIWPPARSFTSQGRPVADRAACGRASPRHRRAYAAARRPATAPRQPPLAARARSAGGPATTRARVSAMRSQVQAASAW